MDFHGITMQGKIVVDKETTLPVWTSIDEGRLIYTEDTKSFYYGTDTEWVSSFSFKNVKVTGQSDVTADEGDDSLTLVGTGGLTITTEAASDTIIFTIDGDNVQSIVTDSGTAIPSSYIVSVLGGEGIDVSAVGDIITVKGENASDSNKGIASFNIDDFIVAAGAVTINDSGIVHDDLTGVGTNSHSDIDIHIGENTAHGISGDVVGTTDPQTFTNKTLIQPVIADFNNAIHDHGSDAKGGRTLNIPIISNFTNATHDHSSNVKGGNTLNTPAISNFTNANHDHSSSSKGGRTLNAPILIQPVLADFTNATHDHSSNVKGGITLAPAITNFTNATHDHSSDTKGGRTLNIPILVQPVLADFTNATHDHSSNVKGGIISFLSSGRKIWIYEDVAPSGWTIVSPATDAILAVKGGSNAYNVSGGSQAGTWIQPDHTHTGSSHTHSTSGHVLTIAEMPWHTHQYSKSSYGLTYSSSDNYLDTNSGLTSTASGGTGQGWSHSHGNTGLSETTVTGSGTTAETYRPLAHVGIIISKN